MATLTGQAMAVEDADFMYALVMFVCYLDGGCVDIMVDILRDEQQCLVAMKEQNLRHAGCYPVEDFIDGFWLPASEYAPF